MMKTHTFVLLLCITIALGFERRYFNRFDADNDDDDGYELLRRRADKREQFLELRTMVEFDRRAETAGIVITLDNGAVMTTRLRVLYTDNKCSPFLEETGGILAGQTKEVTLPANAQNVKVMVEKEIFIGTWREIYNGTVNGQSQCIRITGLVFSSGVGKCN